MSTGLRTTHNLDKFRAQNIIHSTVQSLKKKLSILELGSFLAKAMEQSCYGKGTLLYLYKENF